MMTRERHVAVRSRLTILHTVLSKRLYPVMVMPTHNMTTDEIRNRTLHVSRDTIPDHDYYERPIERSMTVASMIDLMDKITDQTPISINRPQKNIVEIYENIQEYNALWYELMITNSGFCNVPLNEIKGLESVSAYFYETYRKLKLYLINSEMRKAKTVDDGLDSGLLGLMGLMTLPGVRNGKESPVPDFTSFYDLLSNRHLPTFADPTPPPNYVDIPAYKPQDSILALEKAQEQYGVWG